jgi:Mn-dependent DtxR family transcriptional regulator
MARLKLMEAKRQGTEITPAQKAYLVRILAYVRLHGYSPTAREIAKGMKVSCNAVFEICCRLERDGYIKMARNKSRTMTVTAEGERVVEDRG